MNVESRTDYFLKTGRFKKFVSGSVGNQLMKNALQHMEKYYETLDEFDEQRFHQSVDELLASASSAGCLDVAATTIHALEIQHILRQENVTI
jgi:hypothetical protein